MNRFIIAFKAFIKAFKNPVKGQQFLDGPLKDVSQKKDFSHLQLLSSLQHASRFIDFLKEDLSSFNDAQVGAVVRKIHQDSAALIEDLVTIRPLKEEQEGSVVQVPKGYNSEEIKVIGKIKGEPPYTGVLIHRGWKAHKHSLPQRTQVASPEIICPAEIEVKS
ncbi:MAG: DUF2760 domain-containing protein [Parachlamydiaceae bacterium]|nr:DUF2760 domain-containing protein [Parachlamydiaceae bacterium]